jgi:large subunit ribosomal protein L23
MDKTTVLKPRVSEKAYAKSQDNVYVFVVPKATNKHSIASAVEAQFGVTVLSVNTIVSKGKAKRTVRKGGRPIAGRTSDFKKAYVLLKEGDSIAVFAAEEEAKDEKAESAGQQTAKVTENKPVKEQKTADEAPKTKSRFRRKI